MKLRLIPSSTMTTEVKAMVDLRHQAEQRGHFAPLGRLLWMETEHGRIQFPAQEGEFSGPDVAVISAPESGDKPDIYDRAEARQDSTWLVMLGQWSGLPPLRVNSQTPCPKCRHICNVCAGEKKKLCELCGGRKIQEGRWLPCPGAGCLKESGAFKAECITCVNSTVRGQVREELTCPMCDGSGQMICPNCKGTGKFSTGRQNGSVNWNDPACKFCGGSTWRGEWKLQDVRQFVNASLILPKTKNLRSKCFLVVGPISAFALYDFQQRRARLFQVLPDTKQDLLVMLVPRSHLQRPQKAYLVGGVVREQQKDKVSA